jgi:hypothetical protein
LPELSPAWRDFVTDIVVVVLGVLLALALNQVVESAAWQHEVSVARNSIHREMAFDLAAFADRIRVAPCIDRHIEEAQGLIDRAESTGRVPSNHVNLAPPGRLILSGDYDAQKAAQNLVHFPADELEATGLWYDQARAMAIWTDEEEHAWAQLGVLGEGSTRLSAVDVAFLRRDLQAAKDVQFLSVLNAKREIERARRLGVAPGRSRADYVHSVCANAAS